MQTLHKLALLQQQLFVSSCKLQAGLTLDLFQCIALATVNVIQLQHND